MIYNYCYHRYLCLKEVQVMDLKFLKSLKLEDLLNVDYTKLNESEVAYVEKRLVRTANQRIARLKKSGLISQSHLSTKEKKGLSAYKPPKSGTRTTRGGKVVKINIRNKRIKSVNKARDLLLKKTSKSIEVTDQEARYREVISKTLGKDMKIDRRRLKRIGRLMKKAEELYGLGTTNKKLTGSPTILKTVVDIVKSREYIRNDDAERIIEEAIENGYEAAQRMLDQLNDEDSEGLDINFPLD